MNDVFMYGYSALGGLSLSVYSIDCKIYGPKVCVNKLRVLISY
jgi:hypothetical protein